MKSAEETGTLKCQPEWKVTSKRATTRNAYELKLATEYNARTSPRYLVTDKEIC